MFSGQVKADSNCFVTLERGGSIPQNHSRLILNGDDGDKNTHIDFGIQTVSSAILARDAFNYVCGNKQSSKSAAVNPFLDCAFTLYRPKGPLYELALFGKGPQGVIVGSNLSYEEAKNRAKVFESICRGL
jgi:hypothetical protein